MRSVPPRGPRSFRLYGYALTVLIASVLVLALLDRAAGLAEAAERLAFDLTVQALRHAVAVQALQAGRPGAAPLSDRANALEWLDWPAGPEGHYLGALWGADPAAVPGGRWYYDADAGHLVYRLRYAEGFRSALSGAPRIRYEVRLVHRTPGGTDRQFHGAPSAAAVELTPVEPYTWAPARR